MIISTEQHISMPVALEESRNFRNQFDASSGLNLDMTSVIKSRVAAELLSKDARLTSSWCQKLRAVEKWRNQRITLIREASKDTPEVMKTDRFRDKPIMYLVLRPLVKRVLLSSLLQR